MPNPIVSVIVPMKDAEPYVFECLRSVQEQPFSDLEVIVVDVNSADRSFEVAALFSETDSRFKVLRSDGEGTGSAVARKRGAENARGSYLHFLDADDFVSVDIYSTVIPRMQQLALDVAIFGFTTVTTEGAPRGEFIPKTGLMWTQSQIGSVRFRSSVFSATNPSLWNKIWRTDFVQFEVARFQPGGWGTDDLPYTYSAIARADRISVVKKSLYRYRESNPLSQMGQRFRDPTSILSGIQILRSLLEESGRLQQLRREYNSLAVRQVFQTLQDLDSGKSSEFLLHFFAKIPELILFSQDRKPILSRQETRKLWRSIEIRVESLVHENEKS